MAKGVAEEIDCLPNECQALTLNPSTAKKNQKQAIVCIPFVNLIYDS
jgi:hypothetical protein